MSCKGRRTAGIRKETDRATESDKNRGSFQHRMSRRWEYNLNKSPRYPHGGGAGVPKTPLMIYMITRQGCQKLDRTAFTSLSMESHGSGGSSTVDDLC